MDLGRVRRWTGNFRDLTVIAPEALCGDPAPSTKPTCQGVRPGFASRSTPMSAAYPSA